MHSQVLMLAPVQFMDSSVPPREEVEYTSLYNSLFFNPATPLPLNLFDSRKGESMICRLPFPPSQSGFSWSSRLERAREVLPRAVFRPTRPKLYKMTSGNGINYNTFNNNNNYSNNTSTNQNVTVLALEVPQKRGRGRPKKDSTVLVDAGAMNRNSFFVKRTYNYEGEIQPGTSTGVHTLENYGLHGHGGADVNVHEIGICRPERHYLRRNVNLISSDNLCEYDLDDQDVEWLKLVKSSNIGENFFNLNEEIMEKVIEELELGWNILTQPMKKLQQRKEAALYPEEVPCEICGECDTSNCNVIVLCDDCDLAVHQECYGVPHIPEGPWLCRFCKEQRLRQRLDNNRAINRSNCMLCPWPGGALRKTSDHRWVHSLCAHMIPETALTFVPSDPYDLVDVCTLQFDRSKLKCVLCRGDEKLEEFGNGYPLQCCSKMCHVAFHGMCARAAGWCVDYQGQKVYCNKHAPSEAATDSIASSTSLTEPLELKIKLRLNFNGPIIPTVVPLSPTKSKFPRVRIGNNVPLHVSRIGEKLRLNTFAPKVLIDYIAKNSKIFSEDNFNFKASQRIVSLIAKYWTLKRESRLGTPLLKSLQLEPNWSQKEEMSSEAFENEWHDKKNLILSLKELKRKLKILNAREESKLKSLEASREIFEIMANPFDRILTKFILNLQEQIDNPGYFAYPVPCDLFPDYPSIIKYPMDFSTILTNLQSDDQKQHNNEFFYPTLAHFYADLKLIWENSRVYNAKTSVFYQAADRLEAYANELLPGIAKKLAGYGIKGPFDILNLNSNSNYNYNDNDNDNDYDNDNDFNTFYDTFCNDLLNSESDQWPESTPARFPKVISSSGNSAIEGIYSENSGADRFGNSIDSTSNHHRSLKRRGRPPKKRIDGSSTNSSIESISSVSGVSKTPRGFKTRGRPRKMH